jgi:hypothetical protein
MDKNMSNLKISICVPTWEQFGKGKFFLEKLFTTVYEQSYKNFQVVISDHSLDDEIENLCKFYNDKFEIVYFRNFLDRGNSPSNTNNSIKLATGDIIKVLFQDDFFYDKDSLKIISENFENYDCDWLVNGCNHTSDDGETYYREMIPRWNKNIILGINTISSPSVLSFKNNIDLLFDNNLTMLMDCDFYYQLYCKFGEPHIVKNILVTNRFHENQISRKYDKNINDEIEYVKIKFKI